jgi:hypothetical protein
MATRAFPYSRTVSVRRNISSSVTVDALETRGTRWRLIVRPGIRFISFDIWLFIICDANAKEGDYLSATIAQAEHFCSYPTPKVDSV